MSPDVTTLAQPCDRIRDRFLTLEGFVVETIPTRPPLISPADRVHFSSRSSVAIMGRLFCAELFRLVSKSGLAGGDILVVYSVSHGICWGPVDCDREG